MVKKLLTMLLVLAVKGALAGDLIDCEKAQLEVAVSVIFFDQSAQQNNQLQKRAVERLLSCANDGDLKSLVLAGKLLWSGQKIEQDRSKAISFFSRADQGGSWDARVILASLMADLKDQSRDFYDGAMQRLKASIHYVNRCESNGDFAYQLARLYDGHVNYPADYRRAIYFYRFAARHGAVGGNSLNGLRRVEALREEVPQVFEEDENIFKIQLAQAMKGDLKAMYRVGFAFEWGVGVEFNAEEALRWYEQSMNYQPSAVRWAGLAEWGLDASFSKKKQKLEVERYGSSEERKVEIDKQIEFYESVYRVDVEKVRVKVRDVLKRAADATGDPAVMVSYWYSLDKAGRQNNFDYLRRAADAGNRAAQMNMQLFFEFQEKKKSGQEAIWLSCPAYVKNPFFDIY